MEIKTKHSVEEQELHNPDNIEVITKGAESSRFSRRKFLRAGVAASPLLLSVKSPMAWGCGTSTTNGSISAYVSGNASTTSSSFATSAKDPTYWNRVFNSGWFDNHYRVKQMLSRNSVTSSTSFNGLFLSSFFSWQRCEDRDWKYALLNSGCSDPDIGGVLPTGSSTPYLTLRVQKCNNSSTYYDKSIATHDLHKNVTCGYLNAIFAPDIVDYQYSRLDIKNAVDQAVYMTANVIQNNRNSYTSSHNGHLSTLRDNLGRSWSNGCGCA